MFSTFFSRLSVDKLKTSFLPSSTLFYNFIQICAFCILLLFSIYLPLFSFFCYFSFLATAKIVLPFCRKKLYFFFIFEVQFLSKSVVYKTLLIVIMFVYVALQIPIPSASFIALTMFPSPIYKPTCPSYNTRSPGRASS